MMGDVARAHDASPVVSKTELRDGSTSSTGSTPEPDAEQLPQEQQQQKRKGGRKPIYATSEERKQRNRQAQAAFRERRTEYIKQLESTIKTHEENLATLQQNHRTAADECLMLRYKNSLLERILLEKGIDVQAELHAKTGSPNLGPTRVPPPPPPQVPQQPMQRAIMNRQHHARRSYPAALPKADGLPNFQQDMSMPHPSPRSQPTPNSHVSSPATAPTRSPITLPQGGAISPQFGPSAQQQQQLRSQQLRPQFNSPVIAPAPQRPSVITSQQPSSGNLSASSITSAGSAMPNSASAGAGPSGGYYPSPFENHYSQLDQEYDAQADMLDDQDANDGAAGPGPYPHSLQQLSPQSMQPPSAPAQQQQQQHQQQQSQQQQQHLSMASGLQGSDGSAPFSAQFNQLLDPYDPMLDADPFGLSASMHFPTQFPFDAR